METDIQETTYRFRNFGVCIRDRDQSRRITSGYWKTVALCDSTQP